MAKPKQINQNLKLKAVLQEHTRSETDFTVYLNTKLESSMGGVASGSALPADAYLTGCSL
jgi:hypothetical protein